MALNQSDLNGPDLTQGLALSELPDGSMLVGHSDGEQILLVRRGTEIFAVGAHCTHYHGPLGDGLLVGDTVRCPWHHACFDLRSGEALHAPAFDPISCWVTEQRDGKIYIGEKRSSATRTLPAKASGNAPGRIVIIGGGAAGFAAAERLRRDQYRGSIVILSSDDAPPVDRPNLSKDYLAGSAPEEWMPLRPAAYYGETGIELRLGVNVTAIDSRSRDIAVSGGSNIPYDRLLLATGAEPVRLAIPGAEQLPIHTLRTLADCRAIINSANTARRAVVLGASFIGLEVAASLRARGIEVHVVAPERTPMERILGPQMGHFVHALHVKHGVIFHLENTAIAIENGKVCLASGEALETDFVVAGVGVRPRIELAEKAGLVIDRGVSVNSYLQTSDPAVFAAGDIARWPDLHTGEAIRVEHWVVAERMGQIAARNMLGYAEEFTAVPFFWSQHYDVAINYVGHAEKWDSISVEGDITARDCILRFKRRGTTLAAVSISRDIESLKAELAMEREGAGAT